MTVLRESVAIWRKLGLARGILYSAYDILKGDRRKDAIQLRKEIENVLNATASDPPSDLDLDAYEKGRIVACAPRVRIKTRRRRPTKKSKMPSGKKSAVCFCYVDHSKSVDHPYYNDHMNAHVRTEECGRKEKARARRKKVST